MYTLSAQILKILLWASCIEYIRIGVVSSPQTAFVSGKCAARPIFLKRVLVEPKKLKLNPRAAFLKQTIGIAPAICIKCWFLIKWSPQAAFFNGRRITA